MGASVRPVDDGERIRANVAKMRAQGAPDADVDHYLQNVEGLKPNAPAAPGAPRLRLPAGPAAESTASRPGSRPTPSFGVGGVGSAIARGISQGATFGFADEAAAGIDALKDKVTGAPGTYASHLAENRKKLTASRDEHAVGAYGGEAVGALLTGGALGMGRSGIARTMAEGAGYGGLAGAGNASGDLTDRAKGAATGGAVGAIAAPLVVTAGKAAKGIGNAFIDAAGIRPLGNAATREVAGPTRQALRGVVARVRGVETAEERGIGKVAQAVARDAESPTSLRLKIGPRGDKPETIMELAGENTRRLGTAVRSQPGPGSNRISSVLGERQHGAEERAIADAIETTGVGGRTNTVQTADDLIASARTKAKPFYEKAHPVVVDNPEVLATITNSPYMKEAHEIGRQLAHEEGRTIPPLTRESVVGGQTVTEQVPQTVEAIDYTKRGMQALIERKMAGGSMDRSLARVLRDKTNGMLKLVDEQVPDFAEARKLFGGDMQMKEALDTGRDLFKMHPDEIASTVRDFTPGEQELFRKGGVEALADRIESIRPGHDVTTPASKTIDRKRLQHLFPDAAAFDRFKQQLAREVAMTRTNRAVTGGSQTTDKLAALADLAGGDMADLISDAIANKQGLVRRGVGKLVNSRVAQNVAGNTEAVADAASKRLVAGAENPAELSALLDELDAYAGHTATRSRGQRRIGARALSEIAGSRTAP